MFLITLQKYPNYHPQFIVLDSKKELQFVSKLEAHYKVDHVLAQPVTEDQVTPLLQ